jgi:hypothetical protein
MRILLLLFSLTFLSAAAGELYKSEDAAGNVTYSDVPPAGKKADPVKLPPINRMESTPVPPKADPQQATESVETASTYKMLSIIAPGHGSTIRQNTGRVEVRVKLAPDLMAERGDSIAIFLDGTPYAKVTSTETSLVNVDRGTHTLSASIEDKNGKVLMQSAPAVFHLQRFSSLF